MGAAASVRETVAALDWSARTSPDAELRFYNLSLHQDAEADEVGYFGTVSGQPARVGRPDVHDARDLR